MCIRDREEVEVEDDVVVELADAVRSHQVERQLIELAEVEANSRARLL